MRWSRRKLMTTAAGAGAAAAFSRVVQAAPNFSTSNTSSPDFRALVGVFLFGGHDGWNMAVPLDGRYDAYRAARGRSLALPRQKLLPFADTAFGLHPSFAPLRNVTVLDLVLNTGALKQHLSKALYLQRPDLRPASVMLHAEAETHWGREADTITTLARFTAATSGVLFTAQETEPSPGAALRVDSYFRHLTSDVAGQLHRAARMIACREMLGQHHQAFLVSQYGYDTHAEQAAENNPAKGRQAVLYTDLAQGLAAFNAAMQDLGLGANVTAFTMSEFGRSYKGNWDGGTEHAWGNNHLVLGGAATGQAVRGAYPTPQLGGPDDVVGDGRWLPSTSIEQYLAPIARWYGVSAAQMRTVFPNWATWNASASPFV